MVVSVVVVVIDAVAVVIVAVAVVAVIFSLLKKNFPLWMGKIFLIKRIRTHSKLSSSAEKVD